MDPGSEMGKKSGSGSRMNSPDHFRLKTDPDQKFTAETKITFSLDQKLQFT
jgi:hypothetical protein